MSKVVFFTPTGLIRFHQEHELVLAHMLRRYGADVSFLSCDRLLKDDCFPTLSCRDCASRTAFQKVVWPELSIDWINNYSDEKAIQPHIEAIDKIASKHLRNYEFLGRPLGKWCESTLFTRYKVTHIDIGDSIKEKAYRALIRNAGIVLVALNNFFDKHSPDILVTFNGRFYLQRVAIEESKRRNIKFICHDRGSRPQTIDLRSNGHINEYHELRDYWNQNKSRPLSKDAIVFIRRLMKNRRSGGGIISKSYSPSASHTSGIREQLNLDNNPIALAFLSSRDEVAGLEGFDELFSSQIDWLRQIIQYARTRLDINFVIRAHPNLGKNPYCNADEYFLSVLQELRIETKHCNNIRIVLPTDSVSTYELMDSAIWGLSYASFAGLEMACLGKPVSIFRNCMYYGLDFVDSYVPDKALDHFLHSFFKKREHLDIQIIASRFYFLFHSLTSFPIPYTLPMNWDQSLIDLTFPSPVISVNDYENALCKYIVKGTTISTKILFEFQDTGPMNIERDTQEQFFLLTPSSIYPPNAQNISPKKMLFIFKAPKGSLTSGDWPLDVLEQINLHAMDAHLRNIVDQAVLQGCQVKVLFIGDAATIERYSKETIVSPSLFSKMKTISSWFHPFVYFVSKYLWNTFRTNLSSQRYLTDAIKQFDPDEIKISEEMKAMIPLSYTNQVSIYDSDKFVQRESFSQNITSDTNSYDVNQINKNRRP
ncbi:MAG: hypothetical protein KDD48_00720 [Bdellovibrionales bacterium]|nr:hypothetical protein [Bdellovibrionales bacterium]